MILSTYNYFYMQDSIQVSLDLLSENKALMFFESELLKLNEELKNLDMYHIERFDKIEAKSVMKNYYL